MQQRTQQLNVIAVHFDSGTEILVETDASNYILSARVMSHHDDNSILYSVVYFFFKKYTLVECNYEIYGKGLIAIVHCFEEWHAELESIL